MEWSPRQDDALMKVQKWLKDVQAKRTGRKLFRLFGYAGTGKTTLAKYFAEGVAGKTIFAAYTGKAASVLQSHGVPAQTIHSLIYTPKNKSQERLNKLVDEQSYIYQIYDERRAREPVGWKGNPVWDERLKVLAKEIHDEKENIGRPFFQLNLDSQLRDASLLVVDECSMVDDQMAKDLLSFEVPTLVLGDPFQLPPVRGTGYFIQDQPDVLLTEIHRQAIDNPIIKLATLIRNGGSLEFGNFGSSRVVREANPELALSMDQILVGRNKTRLAVNRRIRNLNGYDSSLPVDGEKLVCLRNDNSIGIMNGALYYQHGDAEFYDPWVHLSITPETQPDADPIIVQAHPEHFNGNPDDIGIWTRRDAQEFTYGYALTVHKAQGSQWGKVMVMNESAHFGHQTAQRWLYTAITRAAEEVVIVCS